MKHYTILLILLLIQKLYSSQDNNSNKTQNYSSNEKHKYENYEKFNQKTEETENFIDKLKNFFTTTKSMIIENYLKSEIEKILNNHEFINNLIKEESLSQLKKECSKIIKESNNNNKEYAKIIEKIYNDYNNFLKNIEESKKITNILNTNNKIEFETIISNLSKFQKEKELEISNKYNNLNQKYNDLNEKLNKLYEINTNFSELKNKISTQKKEIKESLNELENFFTFNKSELINIYNKTKQEINAINIENIQTINTEIETLFDKTKNKIYELSSQNEKDIEKRLIDTQEKIILLSNNITIEINEIKQEAIQDIKNQSELSIKKQYEENIKSEELITKMEILKNNLNNNEINDLKKEYNDFKKGFYVISILYLLTLAHYLYNKINIINNKNDK